jgi:hypothetical protein
LLNLSSVWAVTIDTGEIAARLRRIRTVGRTALDDTVGDLVEHSNLA